MISVLVRAFIVILGQSAPPPHTLQDTLEGMRGSGCNQGSGNETRLISNKKRTWFAGQQRTRLPEDEPCRV